MYTSQLLHSLAISLFLTLVLELFTPSSGVSAKEGWFSCFS